MQPYYMKRYPLHFPAILVLFLHFSSSDDRIAYVGWRFYLYVIPCAYYGHCQYGIMSAKYHYRVVSPTTIRLVTLDPGSNDDTLRCQIRHVELAATRTR